MAKRHIVNAYRKQIDRAAEHIRFAQEIAGVDTGVLNYHLQEALKALHVASKKENELDRQMPTDSRGADETPSRPEKPSSDSERVRDRHAGGDNDGLDKD